MNTLTSLPDRPLHGIPPPLWHGPKSLSRPGTPQRSHYSFHLLGDNSGNTPRAVSRPGTPHGSHTPRSLLGSTSSHRPIASPRPKSPPRPVSARLSRVCASSSVGPGAGLLRPRRPDSAPSRLTSPSMPCSAVMDGSLVLALARYSWLGASVLMQQALLCSLEEHGHQHHHQKRQSWETFP